MEVEHVAAQDLGDLHPPLDLHSRPDGPRSLGMAGERRVPRDSRSDHLGAGDSTSARRRFQQEPDDAPQVED